MSKIFSKIASSLGLEEAIIPPQAESPAISTGEKAMVDNQNPFTYDKPKKGSKERASYGFGKLYLPAALISRILTDTEGKPSHRISYIFQDKLTKNDYQNFLDALDEAKIDYVDALNFMKAIKPKKSTSTGQRATKVAKTAEAISKSICKRFKGTPEEMVASFIKMAVSQEFQMEVVGIIKAHQNTFGLNALGYTKTSARKGNPAAQKALAKARAIKMKGGK